MSEASNIYLSPHELCPLPLFVDKHPVEMLERKFNGPLYEIKSFADDCEVFHA